MMSRSMAFQKMGDRAKETLKKKNRRKISSNCTRANMQRLQGNGSHMLKGNVELWIGTLLLLKGRDGGDPTLKAERESWSKDLIINWRSMFEPDLNTCQTTRWDSTYKSESATSNVTSHWQGHKAYMWTHPDPNHLIFLRNSKKTLNIT